MELRTEKIPEFKIYNRYHELEKREREKKELAWEKELLLAMNASNPLGQNEQQQQQGDDDSKARRQNCSQSCPRLNINASNINTRLENSPRLKKLPSCESTTTFHSKSPVLKQFCSVGKKYDCSSEMSENEYLQKNQNKVQTKITVDQCDVKLQVSGVDTSTQSSDPFCTNCRQQTLLQKDGEKRGTGLDLKEYRFCGICLRNAGKEVPRDRISTCDITDSLHGLEYIDRTPSPTEHKHNNT